jgi:hypothetical protein
LDSHTICILRCPEGAIFAAVAVSRGVSRLVECQKHGTLRLSLCLSVSVSMSLCGSRWEGTGHLLIHDSSEVHPTLPWRRCGCVNWLLFN